MSDEADCKCEEGAPGWMVTFADLMTLLLTFFVLLLSMSTLDSQRVKLALGSLRGALGVLEGGGQPRDGRREIASMTRIAQGELELMTTLERIVKKENDKVSNDFIQIGHNKGHDSHGSNTAVELIEINFIKCVGICMVIPKIF